MKLIVKSSKGKSKYKIEKDKIWIGRS